MTQQNNEKPEVVFIDGMYVSNPSEKAPEWIICNLALFVPQLITFLEKNKNNSGYVNVDIKRGQSGKFYASLNTFKPEKKVDNKIIDPNTGRDVSIQGF